jgi:D-alanine-D-alanine ligase
VNITLLVDREAAPADDPALEGKNEALRAETEFHVAAALRSLGHAVAVTPFQPDVPAMVRLLSEAKPDVVFNLTEHVGGDRRKDMHVVALLELLEIPFTGSGSAGLMLCRDKALCKKLLSHQRIKVPDFIELPPGSTRLPRKLPYPMIVKPLSEDGSDGISMASLVRDDKELEERARLIHERRKQPVICEEYVEGREIYVSVIGNQRLRALPPRELRFGGAGEGAPTFATARVKRDSAYRKKWSIEYSHAEIPPELEQRAARVSKRIYHLLQIRDYGRVDYRVTPGNEIVFLEANANPDLSRDDELAQSWDMAGGTYEELVGGIVNQAAGRRGVA